MRIIWVLLGFQLISLPAAPGQSSWLTDDEAREVVAAAVRPSYPEPCYSTYRDERLEDILLDTRSDRLIDGELNKSVYFYKVASDSCEYVTHEKGKSLIQQQITMDCCEYGIVAVDRGTRKSYWFTSAKGPDVFAEFVRDEKLRPDLPEPTLFVLLYQSLVWGGHDLDSIEELKSLVQDNFRSAYSPFERDSKWERKFNSWWRRFRTRESQLKLETTYEKTPEGTLARGYSFSGFELTIPESEPPPKGTPQVIRWAFLIRPNGTVEKREPQIVYSAR